MSLYSNNEDQVFVLTLCTLQLVIQHQTPLIATNGTPIHMYGSEEVTFKLGMHTYTWRFINADVPCLILGADILHTHTHTHTHYLWIWTTTTSSTYNTPSHYNATSYCDETLAVNWYCIIMGHGNSAWHTTSAATQNAQNSIWQDHVQATKENTNQGQWAVTHINKRLWERSAMWHYEYKQGDMDTQKNWLKNWWTNKLELLNWHTDLMVLTREMAASAKTWASTISSAKLQL